uniref:Uncharacterized protein n=1 Tax=Oryza punctata TaxID=4537 RepID=A0A0E0MD10_ORYPU
MASSAASWASGSTIMDWASPEEAKMQRGNGHGVTQDRRVKTHCDGQTKIGCDDRKSERLYRRNILS